MKKTNFKISFKTLFLPLLLWSLRKFVNPKQKLYFCSNISFKRINMTATAKAPLSNLQVELLKLYAKGISDDHLEELKTLIAKFLMDKARKKINAISIEKKITQEI
jgi:hypothetical protein